MSLLLDPTEIPLRHQEERSESTGRWLDYCQVQVSTRKVVGKSMDWFVGTLIILFIFIPLLLFWISALIDIFSNSAISGVGKAGWMLVIILIPLFGALFYFLLRPVPPAEQLT